MKVANLNSERELVADLNRKKATKQVSVAKLRTDERVIARITDGIYRQPSSALRELLANAYDADATEVHIETDVPRFSRIRVADNGLGMSLETLAHVIHHIGGSAKRTQKGKELNLVSGNDATLSPGGRRLIGKIGIGLFSVAQLTRHFQIVTKVEGEPYRSFAEIILSQYSEDVVDSDENAKFEPGTVHLWSENADDISAHGTEVVLLDLKPQTKRLLRSHDVWSLIHEQERLREAGEEVRTEQEPPTFHIGEVDTSSGDTITRSAQVPWEVDDDPAARFAKLMQAVRDLAVPGTTPELDKVLDNYLQTVWTLALSLPLPYPKKHPFETEASDGTALFELSNEPKGQASELQLKKSNSVRQALRLQAGAGEITPFAIFFDGLQLCRPISLYDVLPTKNAVKKPHLFLGKWSPDLSRIPAAQRGGAFTFEAYLCWAPKIVPKEHQGVLIRIHDASGTLFDETFLKYKVSEQNRLRQITAEVYVQQGLDVALNIDRESFNFSHTHFLLLQQWVYGALRQVANTLKRVAKELNIQGHKEAASARVSAIASAAREEWLAVRGEEEDEPPDVLLIDGPSRSGKGSAEISLSRAVVFSDMKSAPRRTAKSAAEQTALDEKVRAIYQVLLAHGVFERMSRKKQEELMRAIVRILNADHE